MKFIIAVMILIVFLMSGCGSDPSNPNVSAISIAYNSNEATGGNVPVDSTSYEAGQSVTILGNTRNLVRDGQIFSGWCTNADCTGITYTQGDLFTMGSVNETFYAKWTIPSSGFTPVILASRNSGELPFHIYVSASDSTWGGVVNHPFDQMEFSWDFGDPGSGNSFVHPVTGATVEANADQTGPEASFIYRSSGTYIVTLTAIYRDIPNNIIHTEQASVSITANDWSGTTRYFDPTDGVDSDNGETTGTPWQTWGKLVDWLSAGDNRRALIRRGTEMSVDETLWLSNSHVRLGDYGSGDKPVLMADNVGTIIRINSDDSVEDHVFSNLYLNGNGGNAQSLIYCLVSNVDTELKALAFVDMVFENDNSVDGEASNHIAIQDVPDGYIEDILVWNGEFIRNNGAKNGIYAEFHKYFAIVGGSFVGGDGSAIRDHPLYPASIQHALYRWIDFKPTISNNFCINNAAKGGKTVKYTLVDGCDITGGQNGLDFTRHNDRTTGWFSDVVIQNNAFHDLATPGQGYGILGGSVERMSIRNNLFYGLPLSDIQVAKDLNHDVSLQIFDNKIWKNADTGNLQMMNLQNIYSLEMENNIFEYEGENGGSRTIGVFTISSLIDWEIDNNQYWAPDMSRLFGISGDNNYSFTGWQELGYDVSSVHEDPEFNNPSEGLF